MTFRVRTVSGLGVISNPRVRLASGLKIVNFGRVRTASGLSVFFTAGGGGGALTVTPNPAYVSGARQVAATVSVTTENTTAIVGGGTAPYTYAWTQQSGTGTWGAGSPTSATTNFTRAGVVSGAPGVTSVWRCTVTDSLGATAFADVAAYVINYSNA